MRLAVFSPYLGHFQPFSVISGGNGTGFCAMLGHTKQENKLGRLRIVGIGVRKISRKYHGISRRFDIRVFIKSENRGQWVVVACNFPYTYMTEGEVQSRQSDTHVEDGHDGRITFLRKL